MQKNVVGLPSGFFGFLYHGWKQGKCAALFLAGFANLPRSERQRLSQIASDLGCTEQFLAQTIGPGVFLPIINAA